MTLEQLQDPMQIIGDHSLMLRRVFPVALGLGAITAGTWYGANQATIQPDRPNLAVVLSEYRGYSRTFGDYHPDHEKIVIAHSRFSHAMDYFILNHSRTKHDLERHPLRKWADLVYDRVRFGYANFYALRLFRLLNSYQMDLYQARVTSDADHRFMKIQIPKYLHTFMNSEDRERHISVAVKENDLLGSREIEIQRVGHWRSYLLVPTRPHSDENSSAKAYAQFYYQVNGKVHRNMIEVSNFGESTLCEVPESDCRCDTDWTLPLIQSATTEIYPEFYYQVDDEVHQTMIEVTNFGKSTARGVLEFDYRYDMDWMLLMIQLATTEIYPQYRVIDHHGKLHESSPKDGQLLIIPRPKTPFRGKRFLKVAKRVAWYQEKEKHRDPWRMTNIYEDLEHYP